MKTNTAVQPQYRYCRKKKCYCTNANWHGECSITACNKERLYSNTVFGTGKIKDLEHEYISVRNCHLCGEEFTGGMYDIDTICPKCKELWKAFVESKERIEE